MVSNTVLINNVVPQLSDVTDVRSTDGLFCKQNKTYKCL